MTGRDRRSDRCRIDSMRMPTCDDRHFGNNEVIEHGTDFRRIACQLQHIVLQPLCEKLEGGIRLFQYAKLRQRDGRGRIPRFFLLRIALLFGTADKLERRSCSGCHLIFQVPCAVFQVADKVEMIMPQGRLRQYVGMALDQTFGTIHNAGIGRVAACLKIKQMDSPGFMVAIIRPGQQCARDSISTTLRMG